MEVEVVEITQFEKMSGGGPSRVRVVGSQPRK